MPPNPQQLRSRKLVLTAAVSVALVSTGSAYLAMVQFGIDVLAMDPATAYATAGVFELSLVTVALLAREAAKDNRPGGTLLTLTWALSSASGAFAAWHEIFIGHPVGAGIFRFLVPLLAALMWHLALIGDRHLATGMSWSGLRQARRMHALFLTTEDLFRAQSLLDRSRSSRRRLLRAEARRRRARSIALRTVPPTEMRAQVAAWAEALSAVGDGTADVARLHADDRRRLAGVLVSDEEPAAPEYERRAVDAVVADLAPTGRGRPALSPAEGASAADHARIAAAEPRDGRAIEEAWTPSPRPESADRPVASTAPAAPAASADPAAERRRPYGEGAAAAVAALTGAAPHAAGVRPIGAPAPQAPAPVRPPTGAIPVATVVARPGPQPVEQRRAAALDDRRTEVRSSAPAPRTDDAERRTRSDRSTTPAERRPGTRLDEATVNRIIDLRAQGATLKSIAKQLSVSERTVSKHLKTFEATGSIPVVRT
ncbi:helix-turn-helix domain-containing protein [Myceligenerans xiligouense]|uniref:Homeodomain-like domain-containing protein n=1 Tax=Myceligenerans xiligouense TaxID=253184 RepID=A0A3N4Z3Y1_9MICO|nr:helix-turn-helix domain-containing protein [Myceligenerans xiligouense]RPF19882.1 Homeodomain-like domain-containing protein [Myceligenerans xiligouense]